MKLFDTAIDSIGIGSYDISKRTHVPDDSISLATYFFSLSDFSNCTIRLISESADCSLIQLL